MADTDHEHEEIRHQFEDALDSIRQGLVGLGSLVVANTRRAGEVLLEDDVDLANEVFEADAEIDETYADLEKQTFLTLARQQPVAGDLRFLVSATRILYELERSGDLAVNCVKAHRRMDGFPDSPRIRSIFERLVRDSTMLFGKGVDAIADMDERAGYRLDQEDDIVDATVSEFYAAIGQESRSIGLEAAIELSRIGRYLERIADHAVNIGENVTYVMTASFPQSQGSSEEE
ncbi:MAG: phosphate signaling complex protein PhoU [Acidimicrobiia bacterium]|nr:phosphate signaling complex protein PhoU [Acidimicrobiia bacterium]